jgi:uncharacterized membrane protein YbhN (UPF0104 family)
MNMQLPGWSREIELFAGLIFLGATAAVFIILWRPQLVQRLLSVATRPLRPAWSTWAAERMEAFIAGLAPLRRPPVLLLAALLSVGVWLLEGSSYLLISRGVNLGLPPNVELPGIGLALVTINLGIMVPSGPGYLGTQEFFGTAALQVVGANPQAALALVVVSHAVQYVLVTGLGLVFFAREQLFPRDVRPSMAEEAVA